MGSNVIYGFAAVMCLANSCQAISIVVGDHFLRPNTPGQIVQINVTGLSTDLVHAMDLNVQIGPTPAHNTPPSGASAKIDYDGSTGHDLNNNIFSPKPHFFADAGSTPYAISVEEVLDSTTGPDAIVVANGALITLIVDTRGFFLGGWPLIMNASNFNGPTDFIDVQANIIPGVSIINGTITLEPEPGSIVTGSIALAALGVLAVRKRRAVRAKL